MDKKNRTIYKTIEYIENHLEDELKLEDVADQVGYSKFHLNRLFSEAVGCTMHKYIQKRRLTLAAQKLVNTDNSIADIAYETNYESQQAFTLAFRQLYLYSPKAYREAGIFEPRQDKFVLYSKLQAKNSNTVCRVKMIIPSGVKAA